MTLDDWLEYILHCPSIDRSHSHVQMVAERLDVLLFSCPVVLVGGTNGKGSCACFLESIYQAAGYRTGCYTSPHLRRVNERIKFNDTMISDKALVSCLSMVEGARSGLSLTFFEYMTLAALIYFKRVEPDVMILEVGIGGRLDTVNAVRADVAVITSVGMDHTDVLGDSREAIGFEKAGLYKPGVVAICGDKDAPQSILKVEGKEREGLCLINRDFKVLSNVDYFDYLGLHLRWDDLPMPALRLDNAAVSLAVVEALLSKLPVSLAIIGRGLGAASLPGRFQRVDAPVPVICDVAHNVDAVRYLAQQLRVNSFDGMTVAVVGFMQNKDIRGMLLEMMEEINIWCAASLSVFRGVSADQIVQNMQTEVAKNCYTFSSVAAAMQDVCSSSFSAASGKPYRVVVFGSFHTVAQAQAYLQVL